MREAYRTIELYDPRRAPCEIDLSDNTSLFGIPPAARRLLAGLPDGAVSRYPSVYADRLKAAIARHHGVDPENVVTGCGSDDVIDSAVRAFSEPGDALAYPTPTFGVVSTFARMNAARPIGIPMTDGLTPDTDALVEARAAVTYLCSPNNPTGAVVDDAVIGRLEGGLDGVLLLDEAYGDFAVTSRTAESASSNRTLSLRTLSKAFGLAGLRVGFAVGPAELIREVEKSRGPYKVSAVAELVASTVLDEDADWVRERVEEAKENRARLGAEIRGRGLSSPESSANFLLVQLPAGLGADATAMELRGAGIGVRPFSDLPALGECIRVTIGPWGMMTRFLEAFDPILEGGER